MSNPNELPTKLDSDLIKSNIHKYASTKLCEMIVCDRYFGFSQPVAIICMEELSKRRAAGDIFDFETHIEETLKQLPPLNFSVPDLRATLQQMVIVNKKVQ